MKLTGFTDYTLRVLMYMALEPERLTTIRQIAVAYGISENHLMKVVHHLAKSGVVESVRGKGGGIRLALPPEKIRIGQVVREAEGNQAIECFSDHHETCRITQRCKLPLALSKAFAAFYDSLDQYTLADMVERRQPLIRILYAAG
ncbi:MAG TPA: Rrf2 family transcriptional regulator [Rhodocyclaceae bacterium]|nr:Rrf2 family transcriptional regulator [Rhodocyclaceae bacterium]